MTYSEKLKSPKWQKRRLEVLSAADFACEECGSKEETLHVHHCYYERGLMPWEYPDEALKCLCANCHTIRQEAEVRIHKLLLPFDIPSLDIFFDDILYAMHMHGIDSVAKACQAIKT